jgi:hypothetical protein
MGGYQERWEQEGEFWKNTLDHIRPTVEQAKPRGAELSRERWDAPEFRLQWYTPDNIGRAVQILLSGHPGHYSLQLSVSAWKDSESDRERRWRTEEDIQTIPVPPNDPLQLELSDVREGLDKAIGVVSGWTESQLTNQDSLPPRPAQLDPIVQGRPVPQRGANRL